MSCNSSEKLTAFLINITKGDKVTQVVAVNAVPPSGSGAQNIGGAR